MNRQRRILSKVISVFFLTALLAGTVFAAPEDTQEDASMDMGFFIETPSPPEGFVLEGMECLFANGTSLVLLPPASPADGFVHEEELQQELGNGLSPAVPGDGAMATWEEDGETRYVLVSSDARIFGGSYSRPLISDVEITAQGDPGSGAYPCVAFLFGGGYNDDVTGNVRITLKDSHVLYVIGGGLHGCINGTVSISSEGSDFRQELIGSSLTDPLGHSQGNGYEEEEQVYNDDTYLISQMQIALNEAGYDCGEPDGTLNAETLEAMMSYQEEHGLKVTSDVLASFLIRLNVLR